MACMENLCTRCIWAGMSNEKMALCPRCGSVVMNEFDELDDVAISIGDDDE